jgi:peptide/nickel transport system ATP-binding protein/oligopeptide transport system ATP-binding protein
MSLISIENLHVHFISRGIDNQLATAKALNGVSFSLEAGQVMGIVGETGAGKSLTANSILGLLRPPAKIVKGRILFNGEDIRVHDHETSSVRGKLITLIPQSPKTSLDPTTRIGDQLIRMQVEHGTASGSDAYARALNMLEQVQIPDPTRRMNAWPHELSGGMAQRVLIAASLINSPKLVIADEPTTGLDLTVQAEILDTLRKLVTENNMSSIIITHDLGIVAHYCDRMAVMFAGSIVEEGDVASVFKKPLHPYTQSLIASTPKQITKNGYKRITAGPPDLYNLGNGCSYKDRCDKAQPICETAPPLVSIDSVHKIFCHFPGHSTNA